MSQRFRLRFPAAKLATLVAMLIVAKELGQNPGVYRERIPAVNQEGRPLPEGQYTLRARLMSSPPIENHLSFQIP